MSYVSFYIPYYFYWFSFSLTFLLRSYSIYKNIKYLFIVKKAFKKAIRPDQTFKKVRPSQNKKHLIGYRSDSNLKDLSQTQVFQSLVWPDLLSPLLQMYFFSLSTSQCYMTKCVVLYCQIRHLYHHISLQNNYYI